MAGEVPHDPISAACHSLRESSFASSLVSTCLQKALFFRKDGQVNFVFVCLFQKLLPMFLRLVSNSWSSCFNFPHAVIPVGCHLVQTFKKKPMSSEINLLGVVEDACTQHLGGQARESEFGTSWGYTVRFCSFSNPSRKTDSIYCFLRSFSFCGWIFIVDSFIVYF